jgi:Family of unknown function (DUF5343)
LERFSRLGDTARDKHFATRVGRPVELPFQNKDTRVALPTSYLTSTKNLSGILNSIVGAQAPEKFTTRFLESLDYKSASDRLVIGVLKSLGFLADDGRPTQRYFDYLDQTRSAVVLAAAIREAYADLFQVNKSANAMSKAEIMNKFKTLSQGQYSESVLDKMAMTFTALCGLADFNTTTISLTPETPLNKDESVEIEAPRSTKNGLSIGGLVYNIQLILPESRDAKVYDALFDALKRHLS